MPHYHWRCKSCNLKVEVERPIAESDVGPEACCPRCDGDTFSKVMAPAQVIRSDKMSLHYPLKVHGLAEKPMVDREGNQVYGLASGSSSPEPLTVKEDVVFTSLSQQRRWAAENGMVLTMDLKDPTRGRDQTSIGFGHKYEPPPSAEAEKLYSKSRFVTEDELNNMIERGQRVRPLPGGVLALDDRS